MGKIGAATESRRIAILLRDEPPPHQSDLALWSRTAATVSSSDQAEKNPRVRPSSRNL